MKTSIRQPRYFRSTGGKALIALAFASALGILSISPALADNDDGHGRSARGERHGNHAQRERRDNREGYGDRPEYYRQPYGYAQPVYVPPPVYYDPRPSPGISIFFPIDLR